MMTSATPDNPMEWYASAILPQAFEMEAGNPRTTYFRSTLDGKRYEVPTLRLQQLENARLSRFVDSLEASTPAISNQASVGLDRVPYHDDTATWTV
jgi:hypothetical protein